MMDSSIHGNRIITTEWTITRHIRLSWEGILRRSKGSVHISSLPPYKFGVSEFTTWPWSFEKDVESYQRLGVDTIEVCEFKLDGARIQDQLALIQCHNLQISSVQPTIRTLFPSQSQPDPRDVDQRVALFCRTIDRFGKMARDIPFVTNTGIPPDGNIQRVFDMAIRDYRALAEFAADRGARIAFEPLNASIVNVETAIWTLQQAMQLVQAVDHPAFGICLDVWNIWQNADVVEAIRSCGDRIFVVQVSDWRTPRSFQDRLIPGQGEIPLPLLLRAIHDTGFRGAYAVEIFSGDVPDSLWEADLAQVVRDSRTGLDQAWQEVFSSDN